jgi:hypothetical protein
MNVGWRAWFISGADISLGRSAHVNAHITLVAAMHTATTYSLYLGLDTAGSKMPQDHS